jgi:hypothetical protein
MPVHWPSKQMVCKVILHALEESKTMEWSHASDNGEHSNELSLVVMKPGVVTLHKYWHGIKVLISVSIICLAICVNGFTLITNFV